MSEICDLQERYDEVLDMQETAYARCCQRLGKDYSESDGHESEDMRIRSLAHCHRGDSKEKDEGQPIEMDHAKC